MRRALSFENRAHPIVCSGRILVIVRVRLKSRLRESGAEQSTAQTAVRAEQSCYHWLSAEYSRFQYSLMNIQYCTPTSMHCTLHDGAAVCTLVGGGCNASFRVANATPRWNQPAALTRGYVNNGLTGLSMLKPIPKDSCGRNIGS